jgi:hypothetical protein
MLFHALCGTITSLGRMGDSNAEARGANDLVRIQRCALRRREHREAFQSTPFKDRELIGVGHDFNVRQVGWGVRGLSAQLAVLRHVVRMPLTCQSLGDVSACRHRRLDVTTEAAAASRILDDERMEWLRRRHCGQAALGNRNRISMVEQTPHR